MSSVSESALLGAALLVATGIALKCRQSSLESGVSTSLSSDESSTAPTRTAGNSSTIDALIGNTPLLKLEKLSSVLGVDIYVKMESMNPSGTGKDRAVQYMLKEAKKHPNYGPNVSIIEGTSGSTGIALAFQCNALLGAQNTNKPVADSTATKTDAFSSIADHTGLQLYIVMPDDQADEKKALLEKLGAKVVITPCCAISNKDHYVNRARRLAEEITAHKSTTSTLHLGGAIFIDQFENVANFKAHYEGTGPEIWRQIGDLPLSASGRRLDAFVMSAGTGGTIGGVSKFLKEQDSGIKVVLADPPGSSLLHKVQFGVCYTPQQSERTVKKHRYDSIVEGVGLDRVTANFNLGLNTIDTGYLIPDQEVVNMAHWLLRNEGLFVGSSSALNVCAAVRTALELKTKSVAGALNEGERLRVVTVICDNGNRHLSRLWNKDYIHNNYKLQWPESEVVPDCIKAFFG
eukprot:gene7891-9407_t